MPVIIEAPDGTEVEFPDGVPPEEMHRSIAEHFSKTSPAAGSLSPAASFGSPFPTGPRTPLQDIQRDFPESGLRAEQAATDEAVRLQGLQEAGRRAEWLRSMGARQEAQDVLSEAGILSLQNQPPQLPEVTAQELQTLGLPGWAAKPAAGIQQGISRAASALLTPEGALMLAAPEAAIPQMATFIPGMVTGGAEEVGGGLGQIAGGETEGGVGRVVQGAAMLASAGAPALHGKAALPEALRRDSGIVDLKTEPTTKSSPIESSPIVEPKEANVIPKSNEPLQHVALTDLLGNGVDVNFAEEMNREWSSETEQLQADARAAESKARSAPKGVEADAAWEVANKKRRMADSAASRETSAGEYASRVLREKRQYERDNESKFGTPEYDQAVSEYDKIVKDHKDTADEVVYHKTKRIVEPKVTPPPEPVTAPKVSTEVPKTVSEVPKVEIYVDENGGMTNSGHEAVNFLANLIDSKKDVPAALWAAYSKVQNRIRGGSFNLPDKYELVGGNYVYKPLKPSAVPKVDATPEKAAAFQARMDWLLAMEASAKAASRPMMPRFAKELADLRASNSNPELAAEPVAGEMTATQRIAEQVKREADPNSYTPAVRAGEGEAPIVGEQGQIHQDVHAAQEDAKMSRVLNQDHGFVGPDGKTWVSKEELGKRLGRKGPVDSQKLRELQAEPKSSTPAEPAPVEEAPTLPERVLKFSGDQAALARQRLAANRTAGRTNMGPLGELPNIRDHAIVLADKIARGTYDAAKWTAEMVDKYGEGVRGQLPGLVADAHNVIREWSDPKRAALEDPTTPIQKVQSVFTPGLEAGKNIKEGVQGLLLPSAKGPEQLQAAEILGSKLGAMHQRAEASSAQLSKPSKAFDRLGVHNPDLPVGENPGIKFMSDMSQGRPLGKFEAVGKLVQKLFSERLSKLEEAGAELQTIRENYFPGMWTRESRLAFNAALDRGMTEGVIPRDGFDINSATPEQKAWVKGVTEQLLKDGKGSDRDMLSFFTKKPLKGNESFRKQKVFDDIMTGAEFGLKPISGNPIDLVKGKLAEMDKSIMANEFFQHLDGIGKLRVIRPGQEVPQGWVKLNDRYGTIYGPPSPAGEFGQRIMGYRIVPEAVGDVVNNYLSSSLYNNPYFGTLYKGWMATANALNQTQLGVGSAFHAGFTTADVQISAGANLLKDIYGVMRGNRSASDLGKTFVTALTSSVRTAMTGDKVLNAWRNPDGVIDPRIAQVVKATELAGGGYKMEKGMVTEQSTKLARDWFSGSKLKAAARSPVALTELMAKPIMDFLVPRQKAGVFSEMAWRIIEQHPGVELADLAPQFRQAWNRVDARLGQVRYDRLFINNTAKNVVQGLVRAPGWTGGTIAEIGGAFPDTVKFLKEWKDTGKLPKEMPDRVAYTMSLMIGTAVANGLLTYLLTGSKPKGLDYVAFRSGHKDEQGNEERFMLPTYVKDLVAYSRQPGTTLGHKSHPLLSVANDVAQNRDYYGYEIRDPHAGALTQAGQTAKYVIKQFEPFWTRGARKEVERGSGVGRAALPLVGIMPAPAYINRTPVQNQISELYHERTGERTKPYGTQEKDAEKRSATKSSTMDVYMFKRLPKSDQEALKKKMSAEEMRRYGVSNAPYTPYVPAAAR